MFLVLVIAITYFTAESLESRSDQVVVQLIGIATIGFVLA